LSFASASRAFFGGGGGAGDGNNNAVGRGGNGGGLAMIIANSVTGSGQVRTNGEAGATTIPAHNDAPGGGGAGGSILSVHGTSSGGLAYQALGGKGGDQLLTGAESEGPGGGGGGGVVAVSSGGIPSATGGINGLTSSSALTEFRANGATRGATGQPNAAAPARSVIPFCNVPAPNLGLVKNSQTVATSGPEKFAIPGADVLYTIAVTNPSLAVDSGSLVVIDLLPTDVEFLNADIDGGGPLTLPIEFVEGTPASGVGCCVAANISYSQFASGTDFTYVPVAGYDPLVRRIRVIPTGSMAAALLGPTKFSLRLKVRIKPPL
jgi:uncharacterized repeat protein (TIGR01451 family)